MLIFVDGGADKLRQKSLTSDCKSCFVAHASQSRVTYTNANTFVAKVKNAFASLSLAPVVA